VADVVDKGAGAALFMALSWTLFRTCAMDFPSQPELVLSAVNNRILENTEAKQFLTAFYGILEPDSGALVYCNAGHCPPYLFRFQDEGAPIELLRTGVPLGIFDDQTWSRGNIQIDPGDVLILYSDGTTEAQNMDQDFYGEERLKQNVSRSPRPSAQEVHETILTDIQNFIGDAVQSDDIVLSVVLREVRA
jgi:serine phosphatase RsbU (regulator of sigma subunit)